MNKCQLCGRELEPNTKNCSFCGCPTPISHVEIIPEKYNDFLVKTPFDDAANLDDTSHQDFDRKNDIIDSENFKSEIPPNFVENSIDSNQNNFNFNTQDSSQNYNEMFDSSLANKNIANNQQHTPKPEEKNNDLFVGMSIIISIVVGIISLIIILILFTVFVVLPSIGYKNATKLMTDGDYRQAREIFLELDDYKDSRTMLLETYYLEANQLMKENEFQDAMEIYETLAEYEYKDSAVMVLETHYQQAILLLNSHSYDNALEIFTDLGDYKDSKTMALETNYQKALSLMVDGKYTEANTIFASLGDYKDSAVMVSETIYLQGIASYDVGHFPLAKDSFSQVQNYKDSQTYLSNIDIIEKYQGTWQNTSNSSALNITSSGIYESIETVTYEITISGWSSSLLKSYSYSTYVFPAEVHKLALQEDGSIYNLSYDGEDSGNGDRYALISENEMQVTWSAGAVEVFTRIDAPTIVE